MHKFYYLKRENQSSIFIIENIIDLLCTARTDFLTNYLVMNLAKISEKINYNIGILNFDSIEYDSNIGYFISIDNKKIELYKNLVYLGKDKKYHTKGYHGLIESENYIPPEFVISKQKFYKYKIDDIINRYKNTESISYSNENNDINKFIYHLYNHNIIDESKKNILDLLFSDKIGDGSSIDDYGYTKEEIENILECKINTGDIKDFIEVY